MEFRWLVGKKSLHTVEIPDSIWIRIGEYVEKHAFGGNTEADGMRAFGEKGVIIELGGIPMVEISWAASNSAGEVCQSTNQNLSCVPSCERRSPYAEGDIGSVRIDRF